MNTFDRRQRWRSGGPHGAAAGDFASALGKPLGIALGVLVVGAVAWWFFGDKLKAAANKINPASDQNFIYKDVIGGIGGAVTGQKDFSLGSWFYDLFNEDANLAGNPKPRTPRPADEIVISENLGSRIGGG